MALRRVLGLSLAILALLAPATGLAESYSLAVIPSAPPAATRAQWAPFLERLSRETGLSFELKLYEKIDRFEDDFAKGVPDLLFVHPVQATAARKEQAYEPLVRGGKPIAGVVFVRKDSPIQSVKDLQGKLIVMVGSRNVCSLMVGQELTGGEKVDFRYRFAGTAPRVVQEVLSGKADAGASLDSAFDAELPETRGRLRIVLSTPPVATHPLAAHPRVPLEAREKVTAAILKMAGDPEGQALLAGVRLAAPVKADYARDYSALEKVDSRLFSTEE